MSPDLVGAGLDPGTGEGPGKTPASPRGPTLKKAVPRITTGPVTPPRRGRPRKAESGHSPGTAVSETRSESGPGRGAKAQEAIAPRLLSLDHGARYLGVSPRTLWTLIHNGVIKRVRFPVGEADCRRILLDVRDLDRLVDTWKDG